MMRSVPAIAAPWDDLERVREVISTHVGDVELLEVLGSFADHFVASALTADRGFIFKCGVRDSFGIEAWACDRAASLGVPVPTVVAVDESRERFDVPYLILEKLRGLPLHHTDVPVEVARSVVVEAGRHLRELHEERLEGFGWADPDAFERTGEVHGQDSSWREYVDDQFEEVIPYLVEHGVLERSVGGAIDEAKRRAGASLDSISEGRLLHADFTENHIYVDPGRGSLAGIIDWGDVHSGDPAFELAIHAARSPLLPFLVRGYEPDDVLKGRVRELFPLYKTLRFAWVAKWMHERGMDPARSLNPLLATAATLTGA